MRSQSGSSSTVWPLSTRTSCICASPRVCPIPSGLTPAIPSRTLWCYSPVLYWEGTPTLKLTKTWWHPLKTLSYFKRKIRILEEWRMKWSMIGNRCQRMWPMWQTFQPDLDIAALYPTSRQCRIQVSLRSNWLPVVLLHPQPHLSCHYSGEEITKADIREFSRKILGNAFKINQYFYPSQSHM